MDIWKVMGHLKNENWFGLGMKSAFAYVGTVVGAGFASGQEILRFFTVYGGYSIWAILIATFLFVWVGIKILQLGLRLNSRSFRSTIALIFGAISPIVSGYMILSMVLIGAAMLAGAGALFEEYIHMPFWAGIIVTALITLAIVLYGMKGILTVNAWIVPIIFMFNICLFVYTLINSECSIISTPPFHVTPFDLLKAGVFYASFNIILSVGVLAPMASEVNEPKALLVGGILGGGTLGTMLFVGNYCLLSHAPAIYNYEIPMVFIVQQMGPLFSNLYALIIWGGILTTLVANFFSIASMINEVFRIPVYLSSTIVMGLCFVLSFLGFSQIVTWVYPLLGMIGFFLVVFIIIQVKY
jgi:uncharacterized membrane protein YkvI